MDILTATKDFEKWVSSHTEVVKSQFSDKHKQMAESPVQFLRGTFYRWTQLFPKSARSRAKRRKCCRSEICISPASARGATGSDG